MFEHKGIPFLNIVRWLFLNAQIDRVYALYPKSHQFVDILPIKQIFTYLTAKEQFAKEIKSRAESGYLPVIEYLIIEGYFEYLPPDYINVLVKKTDFLSQFASDHKLLYIPHFCKILVAYKDMVNKEFPDFSQISLSIGDFLEASREAFFYHNKYRDPIGDQHYLDFEIALMIIIYQGIGQEIIIFSSNVEEILISVLTDIPNLRNWQEFRTTFIIPIVNNCLDDSIAITKKGLSGESDIQKLRNLKQLSKALDFNKILSKKYNNIYADIIYFLQNSDLVHK